MFILGAFFYINVLNEFVVQFEQLFTLLNYILIY